MSLKDFSEFVEINTGRRMAVSKMKNLDHPAWGTSSIPLGEPFTGTVKLRHVDDGDFSGYQIVVGDFYLRTSVIRDVVQKSPTKWLAKTLNSVYRVEIIE